MTHSASLSALDLLHRWDAQQAAYIKYRDQRFDVMVNAIRHRCGDAPRVLDLACGPGSTSMAILDRLPGAQIVAVDKDPILLAIARQIFDDRTNVDIRDADLDTIDWLESLEGNFNAVVSSTALHWLNPDALSRLYFALAERVVEGGLFLNADHLHYDEVSHPEFRELAQQDDESNQSEAHAAGTDTWAQWWDVAQSHPDFAHLAKERELIWEGKAPPPKVTLGYHLETLRSAGFRQTGTIWQYLDDYVVCAIR